MNIDRIKAKQDEMNKISGIGEAIIICFLTMLIINKIPVKNILIREKILRILFPENL